MARSLSLVTTLVLCVGCNAAWGIDELSYASSSGMGGSNAGGSGGLGLGGVAVGGAGGIGATGGGPGTGGSVVTSPDCSGEFGSSELVLAVEGVSLSSPAIAVQERVLYYGHTDANGTFISRSERVSTQAAFAPGAVETVLSNICANGEILAGIDVSWDDQRAYVACSVDPDTPGEVWELVRGDNQYWQSLGAVAILGGGAAISPDGLTLLSTGAPAFDGPLRAQRAALADTFGTAELVPGLTGEAFRTPSLAADDVTLFGYVLGGGQEPLLGYYIWSSPAGAYEGFIEVPTGLVVAGAPDVSEDCRALYVAGLATSQDLDIQIFVLRRSSSP